MSRSTEIAVARALCAVLVMFGVAACSTAPAPAADAVKGQQAAPALPLAEKDPADQRKKAVQAHLEAGIEALKLRDPERARRHISRALELDPGSAEANNAMALLYRYEGDDKREEEYFRKAIRENGGFSQARNNYAGLLYRKGRYKEAISQLERATDDTDYDQRAIAFLNLGRCYAKVGEYDKALSALQRSLRLDSNQSDAPLELADVLLAQQKYKDANDYLAMFLARERNTARSLWIGIRVATALGDSDKVGSYEFQLGKMYKGTPEYAEWQAWKNGTADKASDKRKAR